jgi:polar amino acid transport system substrate-binding protein
MLLAWREGAAQAPTSATDLIGVPTGVEIDTLADTYLLSALGGRLRDDVRHYTNVGEAMDAMVAGEIDAVLGNGIEVEAAAHAREGVIVSRVAMPGLFVAQWDLGAAVKSGTGSNLAARLNDAMAQLDEDGRLDEIFSRYGATRVPPSIRPRQ